MTVQTPLPGVITHPEAGGPASEVPFAGESTCGMCPDLPHPVLTHCTRCHASWTRSSRTAHCMTCHRTFAGPSVFDRHLLKEGCTDPAGVTKRNGERVFADPHPNAAGTPVWSLPGSWEGPDGKGGQP